MEERSSTSVSASVAAANNANAQDREIDLQEFLATHQFRNPTEIAARIRSRSRMYNRDRMQSINSVTASQPSASASHLDSITLFTPEAAAAAPPIEAPAPSGASGRSAVQSPNPFRAHDGEDSDEDGTGRLSPIALEGLQASHLIPFAVFFCFNLVLKY